MSRKIARITQEKKLLLANEVVEDNRYSLNEHGKLYTKNILEGNKFSIDEEFIEVGEFIEGYPLVKPVIDDSLVLWLDGSTGNNYGQTGTWTDLSGNGNDGELKNFNFTEDSGWVDGGLRFDGVDDYVQLPDLNLNPNNFTYQLDDKIISFRGDSQAIVKGGEIEYSGRNLFSNKFYKDINNYDGVLVYRYHLTNLKSSKRYAVRSWLKEGEVAESGFWITLTSGHPNPNNASANGGTYSHIINNGDPVNSQVLLRNDVPVYISYFPPNADLSILDKYNISIQQLDSGYIQEWTPAPEDITETNIINHTTPFVENNTIHIFRFYNRALTDEEILQNYQAGQCSPLLAMRGDVIG